MSIIGSSKPILVLSYQNCDIHCCHLDGYKKNMDALSDRLKRIEIELFNGPEYKQYRLWYNLDGNRLHQLTMQSVAASICRLQSRICKIAFIGLNGIDKWRFEKLLKNTLQDKTLIRTYFTDAELAKGWLI